MHTGRLTALILTLEEALTAGGFLSLVSFASLILLHTFCGPDSNNPYTSDLDDRNPLKLESERPSFSQHGYS